MDCGALSAAELLAGVFGQGLFWLGKVALPLALSLASDPTWDSLNVSLGVASKLPSFPSLLSVRLLSWDFIRIPDHFLGSQVSKTNTGWAPPVVVCNLRCG